MESGSWAANVAGARDIRVRRALFPLCDVEADRRTVSRRRGPQSGGGGDRCGTCSRRPRGGNSTPVRSAATARRISIRAGRAAVRLHRSIRSIGRTIVIASTASTQHEHAAQRKHGTPHRTSQHSSLRSGELEGRACKKIVARRFQSAEGFPCRHNRSVGHGLEV